NSSISGCMGAILQALHRGSRKPYGAAPFARRSIMKTLAIAAVLLAAAAASADEPKAQAPALSPAEQSMMEKYTKAATPGPEHQQLAKLAGKWDLQVTSWMTPGGAPMKSTGTAEFKPVLGG